MPMNEFQNTNSTKKNVFSSEYVYLNNERDNYVRCLPLLSKIKLIESALF